MKFLLSIKWNNHLSGFTKESIVYSSLEIKDFSSTTVLQVFLDVCLRQFLLLKIIGSKYVLCLRHSFRVFKRSSGTWYPNLSILQLHPYDFYFHMWLKITASLVFMHNSKVDWKFLNYADFYQKVQFLLIIIKILLIFEF